MNNFDKIIGFKNVKQELERVLDIMKNKEKYNKLGVHLPRGILLYGEAGLGKTSFANCFLTASGWKNFICRKDEPNGDFVKTIKRTFEEATKNEPCVILLDDMDKFANEDEYHRNAEEFVAIQSCIDSVKDKEVLVFATANDTRKFPSSLLRAGRFDRKIELRNPVEKDAVDIIKYYLSQKQYVDDINAEEIAYIMGKCSCAELERLINEAGIYAGYENKEKIEMKHIIEACLKLFFNAEEENDDDYDFEISEKKDLSENVDFAIRRAYHECGHAVVTETLTPDKVVFLSIETKCNTLGGITVVKPRDIIYTKKHIEEDILISLAGKASAEIIYGENDLGANKDIHRALGCVEKLIDNYCMYGFNNFEFAREHSNDLKSRRENAIFHELERYYQQAKKMLMDNREFLEKLTKELLKKKTLLSSDIQRIKKSCNEV